MGGAQTVKGWSFRKRNPVVFRQAFLFSPRVNLKRVRSTIRNMARRQGWSRTFRKDSKLQQYFLDRVVPTGKTLGVGSYGSVLEVSEAF